VVHEETTSMDTTTQRSQRHRTEKELPLAGQITAPAIRNAQQHNDQGLQQPLEALWIRLPKPGQRCPVSSLSRATLNELILGPDAPVRSAVIRKRGNTRGIRLICKFSLLSHIHANSNEKTATLEGGK